MNFRDALRELDARRPESIPAPSLERMRSLMDLLDHPELTYPTIHVTGTNGKTTTARIVTALTCAHGLTTGTLVSPHLDSVTERISVCGRPITEEEFGEEYERLLPYFERVDATATDGLRISYFEALTTLGFLWLADKPVSLAVVEVGMGGTWDATNLVRGDVAVLCPIGLDHTDILGPTVAAVAGEKAGIIKEGRIAVVRAQRPEAMEVLERRCREVGAVLLPEGGEFDVASRAQAVGGQVLAVRGIHGSYDELFVPLLGEEAARNVAASIAATEALLGRALDERAVRDALGVVASPGRVEVVARQPLVVLDGAHNPDAIEAVVAALRDSFRWKRMHLVAAMFDDKDVESVMALVAPLVDRAFVARNSSPRAAAPERLAAALRSAGVPDVETFATAPEALEAARSAAAPSDLILVTGSFYTVADVRPLLVGATR